MATPAHPPVYPIIAPFVISIATPTSPDPEAPAAEKRIFKRKKEMLISQEYRSGNQGL